MITSIVPARDINGPRARMYSSRDTIFVSSSGKDGYLGYTPTTPIKTLKKTSDLLKLIRVNPTTVNIETGIYNGSLTINESASGRPITINGNSSLITQNLSTFSPTLSTSGYLRYDIPTDINDNFNTPLGNFYVNDSHLKPLSFPRLGTLYGTYLKLSPKVYRVRDDSGFLSSISPIINTHPDVFGRGNAWSGTAFSSSHPIQSPLSSITLSSNNIYILTFSQFYGSDSFSIIPFTTNCKMNFSTVIDDIELYPGDYILSKENIGNITIYCKPQNIGDNKLKVITSTSTWSNGQQEPEICSVYAKNIDNIKINDIHTMYGDSGLYLNNTSNVSITGCKFKNSKFSNVYLYTVSNINFSKNMIASSGYNSLEIRVLSSVVIDNNIIYGSGLNATGEGAANAIYTSLDYNPVYGKPVKNLTVTNNTIKYSSGGALDINFVNTLKISGNKIENTGFGFSEDMAGLRTGACGPGDISNNMVRYVRPHTARTSGGGIYIDGQNDSIQCYKNISDEVGNPYISNEPSRHNVYNNIFINGRSSSPPWLLGFTTSSDNLNLLGHNPTYYALSAFNNIHIAAKSNAARYLTEYTTVIGEPSHNFFTSDSQNPALRLTHKFFSSNQNDHKIFYTIPGYGSGNNHFYMRIGVYGGRPVYTTGNNCRLIVEGGNWTQTFWYYNTFPPALSTSCGISNYNYPWEVPASEWFEVSTNNRPNLQFIFHSGGGEWKRSIPYYTQDRNCFYTNLDVSTIALTLSTDVYAFHGESPRDINKNSIISNWPSINYAQSISGTNRELIPLSASFEEVSLNWNTSSIFEDPQIDPETYIVNNIDVKNYLHFEDIDIDNIGVKNNPFIEDIGLEKFSPTWGSLDWSESLYGNHNDLPIPEKIISTILNLRNYTYYYDSPVTVAGIGRYQWDKSSGLPDDGINIIKPNAGIHSDPYVMYGRWVKII